MQYTTGELARRCGVSVRTVQYYDGRGVLVPSEVSQGGRRLYDEEDVRRLSVITFLRELGFSLNQITDLLADDRSPSYIDSLIDAQCAQLGKRIELDQRRLETLGNLRAALTKVTDADRADVHAFSDAAYVARRKRGLNRIHGRMLAVGFVMDVLEAALLVIWIRTGDWVPFAVGLVPIVALGVAVSAYYIRSVAFLCPNCHTVFRPPLRRMLWAAHNTYARKLTCPVCRYDGWCLEVPAARGSDSTDDEPLTIV